MPDRNSPARSSGPVEVFQVLNIQSDQVSDLYELRDHDLDAIFQHSLFPGIVLLLMDGRRCMGDARFHEIRKYYVKGRSLDEFNADSRSRLKETNPGADGR